MLPVRLIRKNGREPGVGWQAAWLKEATLVALAMADSLNADERSFTKLTTESTLKKSRKSQIKGKH